MPTFEFENGEEIVLPKNQGSLGIATDVAVKNEHLGVAHTDGGFKYYKLVQRDGKTTVLSNTPNGIYSPDHPSQPGVPDRAVAVCISTGTAQHPYPIALVAFAYSGIHPVDIFNIAPNGQLSSLGTYHPLTFIAQISGCNSADNVVYAAAFTSTQAVNYTIPGSLTAAGNFATPAGGLLMNTVLAAQELICTTSLGAMGNPIVFIFTRGQFSNGPVGNYSLPNVASSLELRDGYLWIASGSYDVVILNLADPTRPAPTSTPVSSASQATNSVLLRGRFALTTNEATSTVRAESLTGTARAFAGTAVLRGQAVKLVAAGPNVVSLNSGGSFGIHPVQTVQPEAGDVKATGDSVSAVTVAGDKVFTRGSTSVQMFSAADQGFLAKWDIPNEPTNFFNAIAADPVTGKVYTTDIQGLYRITPSSTTVDTSTVKGTTVAAVNSYVFTGGWAGYNPGLSVYNDADLLGQSPTPIFSDNVGNVYDLKIPEPYNKLYVSATNVRCYDISNLPTVTFAWQCSLPSPAVPLNLDSDGSITVVTSNTGEVYFIDNTTHEIVGKFGANDLPGINAHDVKLRADKRAVITDKGNNVVAVIDYTVPSAPVLDGKAATSVNPGELAVSSDDDTAFVAGGASGVAPVSNLGPRPDPAFTQTPSLIIVPGETRTLTRINLPINAGVETCIPAVVRNGKIVLSDNPSVAVSSVPANIIPPPLNYDAKDYPVVPLFIADPVVAGQIPPKPEIQWQVAGADGVKMPQNPVDMTVNYPSGSPTLQIPQITINEDESKQVVINVLDSDGNISPTGIVTVEETENCFFSLTSDPETPITSFKPADNCNPASGKPQLKINKPDGNKLPGSFKLKGGIGGLAGASVTIDKDTVIAGNQKAFVCTFYVDSAQVTKAASPSTLSFTQAGPPVTFTSAMFDAKDPNAVDPADKSKLTCAWSEMDGATVSPSPANCTDIAAGLVKATPSDLYRSTGTVTGKFCVTNDNKSPTCETFSGGFGNQHQRPTATLRQLKVNKDVRQPLDLSDVNPQNDRTYPLSDTFTQFVADGCWVGFEGSQVKSFNATPAQLSAGTVGLMCYALDAKLNATVFDYDLWGTVQQYLLTVVPPALASTEELSASETIVNGLKSPAFLTITGLGIISGFIWWQVRAAIDYRKTKSLETLFQTRSYGELDSLLKKLALKFFKVFNTDAVSRTGVHSRDKTEPFLTALNKILKQFSSQLTVSLPHSVKPSLSPSAARVNGSTAAEASNDGKSAGATVSPASGTIESAVVAARFAAAGASSGDIKSDGAASEVTTSPDAAIIGVSDDSTATAAATAASGSAASVGSEKTNADEKVSLLGSIQNVGDKAIKGIFQGVHGLIYAALEKIERLEGERSGIADKVATLERDSEARQVTKLNGNQQDDIVNAIIMAIEQIMLGEKSESRCPRRCRCSSCCLSNVSADELGHIEYSKYKDSSKVYRYLISGEPLGGESGEAASKVAPEAIVILALRTLGNEKVAELSREMNKGKRGSMASLYTGVGLLGSSRGSPPPTPVGGAAAGPASHTPTRDSSRSGSGSGSSTGGPLLPSGSAIAVLASGSPIAAPAIELSAVAVAVPAPAVAPPADEPPPPPPPAASAAALCIM